MSDLLNKASLVVIPSGYKEDTVYSVVPSDGSGDLSFTRASNGTRINSAGLVEVCPWNLLEESEDFSNGVWVKTNTTVSTNTTTAPNGTTTADSLLETTATGDHRLWERPALISGQDYTFTMYVKQNGRKRFQIKIFDSSSVQASALFDVSTGTIVATNGTSSIENVGNGWYRCSIVATSPTSSTGYTVLDLATDSYSQSTASDSYAGDASKGVYIWGAQLNIGATAKPYFPTTDRLNVPRLTYQNGGGGCPSLLLEKQSTNLNTYSEDWSTGWTGANRALTTNDTTSPDGTQNADKLGATGGTAYYAKVITSSTGSNAFSVFMKYGNRQTQQIYAYAGGSYFAQAVFDLQNGTVSSTISGSAQIESYGNGWYRCTVIGTASATSIEIGIENISDNTYTYCWGAQLEQSSYPTSYIPTTSASATRVADACSKTGISSLIGQSEGTLFCEINTQQSPANNWFQITDGTANNWVFIGLDQNSLRGYVRLGSSTVFSDTSFNFTNGVTYKMALRYKSGDIALYINGNAIASNAATYTVSASISQVIFGDLTNPPNDSAKYSQAIIFPTALTNAELASLTTI